MRNELVKEIRYYLGMTQHEFAEWLGVNYSTIAAVETNYRNVSDKLAAKIALKFDVTDPEFLAYRERRAKTRKYFEDASKRS